MDDDTEYTDSTADSNECNEHAGVISFINYDFKNSVDR